MPLRPVVARLHRVGLQFMDEPTRNFSPLSNPVILRILQAYGGAIISISHDRKYIAQVCDRVLRLTSEGFFLSNRGRDENSANRRRRPFLPDVEGTPSASLRGRGLLSSRHKAREVEGIAGAPGAADRTPLYGARSVFLKANRKMPRRKNPAGRSAD